MSRTMRGAGKEVDHTKRKFGHLRGEMKSMGKGSGSLKGLMGGAFKDIGGAASSLGMAGGPLGMVAGGVLAIGAAAASVLVPFGKESVDTFMRVAGEVNQMKRALGGTPEEASHMRVAFHEVGIESGKGTKAIQMFSKKLDASRGSSKAHAKMVKALGGEYLDAHGKIIPMTHLLPQVADKFATMPDGPEKTALAMKLFGKAGADMIPFLNKGSKGMEEAAKKSDKFGNTLSGKNLQAMKDNKAAQRDWSLAVEGLKTRFGAELLPMLTKVITWLQQKMIPALVNAGHWWETHQEVIKKVVRIIATALGVFMKVQTLAWRVIGKAIKAVGAIFIWLWNNAIQPAISKILSGVATVMRLFARMLEGLSHVPGFGWAKDAARKMNNAADKADQLRSAIKKIPTSKTVDLYVRTRQTGRIRLPNGTQVNYGLRAGGGPVLKGRQYLVGENGPELLHMGASGHVTPARQTAAAMSGRYPGGTSAGSASERPILVQLVADGRVLQEILVKRKKRTGVPLGLA